MHEFVIVIPSEPSKHEYRQLYFKIAQHIASSWYLFGRGGCQILYDDQVLDGDAARYNMIVLGGADENKWTKRRESEGTKVMVKFLQGGGFGIGNRKYTKPGTGNNLCNLSCFIFTSLLTHLLPSIHYLAFLGIIFLGPNPTRTRLGLFIAGTDMEGFLRAAWTIPFRTGLMVPDYLIVGEEYGDPATGWTNFPPKVDQFERKRWTKGSGGILAAGYWSNVSVSICHLPPRTFNINFSVSDRHGNTMIVVAI